MSEHERALEAAIKAVAYECQKEVMTTMEEDIEVAIRTYLTHLAGGPLPKALSEEPKEDDVFFSVIPFAGSAHVYHGTITNRAMIAGGMAFPDRVSAERFTKLIKALASG